MKEVIMDEGSHAAKRVTRHLIRRIGISGLAIVASLGLAGRVHATYLHLNCAPAYAERYNAGDYIDREWYYLLDDAQYHYLDRGQYNLLGELGYLLGHPCYPKLYERDLDQVVGFTNRVNTGWFSFRGGQVLISEYDVWCCYFNVGDYIDRRRYYYLDKGRYYYLDRGQYNWLGGLGYMFERSSYQRPYVWGPHQSVDISATPEPSTIVFLGLGVLGVLAIKR
jgi:hypothetical protein